MKHELPTQFNIAGNPELQKRQNMIQKLINEIKIKGKEGKNTIKEKVTLIEILYAIDYSDEEKKVFDNWLGQVSESSAKKPIIINSIEEIEGFLPQQGNYRVEKVNLFFRKDRLSSDELQIILEKFSLNNPSFEISIMRHDDSLFSIGIGNKTRNGSTILDGEYFGHYHPTQFEFKNREILPNCFTMGLMPSSGDVKGFLKYTEAVKKGTRIFSKNGYILIKPITETRDPSLTTLDEFTQNYFDLFLGINKLGLKSDEEVKNYFRKNFGFDIEFHYYKK